MCGWSLDAAAALSLNPSPVDTGAALIGDTTSPQMATLSSTSNVKVHLDLTNNCMGGGGTFTLSKTNLNVNPTDTFSVTYSPTARGVRTCRVDVLQDGNNDLLGYFNVRGEGEAPATMVTSGTSNFGATRWNDAAPVHSTTRTFTVSNMGDRQLDVTLALSGTNAGDYTITAGGTSFPIGIPGGGAKTWTVTFDPQAGGDDRSATLTITGNDTNNPSDTFNLLGDGTNAVINVPGTLFVFMIVNAGSSQPIDLPVSNIGGAQRGPLGVTSAMISDPNNSGWFSFTGSCSGQSCNFSPALSITNGTTNVAVRCSPPATANANDVQNATVTFTSDTDNAASNPANTATLKCTAGKSNLATNQNVVSFTPSLVASTTSPNTVMITNNGNVGTTFTLTKTGANQGAFTLSTPAGNPVGCGLPVIPAPPACMIGPMSSAAFSVTFTPGTEGDISAGVTITPANSSPVQVTLTGRGIDRHIQLNETMIQFPDTFRNPGDKAAVMPVTIKNSGEYPLNVTSVLLDGAPNWQLAEPFQPFQVEGLGSHDVNVLFTPVTAGKAPDGMLLVTSDDPDPARKMVPVVVSGNGKDRNVEVEGPIDFGNTGAGVPVKLSQIKTTDGLLSVINNDAFDFKIRDITSDMPDVFQIQRLDGSGIDNMDLVAGTTERFEIVFTPPKVGDYTANVTVFLDQDMEGQRTIQVHGNALFVDAHGGGGCSTGNGTGGGALLALMALLRRKRPRA